MKIVATFPKGREGELPRDREDREIDFGRTADDYDRHRPGFPAETFARLEARRWIEPGLRAIDVGTGTGAMALELARRAMKVTAIDRAPELLAVLARRAREEGLDVRVAAKLAEDTGEADRSYDLYTAAQCWWWFDPDRAIAEARRVLVPGGRIIIASFNYMPLAGSAARRTEDLLRDHNPRWTAYDCPGLFPEQVNQLARAGMNGVESFSFDVDVPFTHEGWRGRIRACNGVGASLAPNDVEAFDRAHRELLEKEFPGGKITVLHRVFVVTATTT